LKNSDFDLKFFSDSSSSEIGVVAKKIRSNKNSGDTATSKYYVLNNEFDFIQVSNLTSSGASGIIIPKWPGYVPGNEIFSFAIDFGTTNTHIEYKIKGGSPKPFDITPGDVQIATLFHPEKTSEDFGGTGAIAIREIINDEFVPNYIGSGSGSGYKFPHRTVISENQFLNIDTETFSLADFNIPFSYEKKPLADRVQTNLKWAKKEKGNTKRIGAFFETIIMLLRNKVLFNKGDLSKTRLIWFYPSSMKPARKSDLESAWEELFVRYFKSSYKPTGITESLAPFYYFKGANKLQGGSFKPVVSIDIGGGTTDIVVFQSNKPLLLTSFKFAANIIFGDGFSEFGAASTNGIINKYYPYFDNLLSTNKLYDLSKILSSLMERNKSEDINAFFFSIENYPKITDKKSFSYNSVLSSDEDLKLLFIYFYSAVIYHIAELMKFNNIDLPKHLIFSGTGSKVLNIITPDFKILSNLSRKIFEAVFMRSFDQDGLTVEMEKKMPKEVTCKGGLMSNPEDLDVDIQTIRAVLTCLENQKIFKLSYNELYEQRKVDIINYVQNFNEFFLKLHSQYNFVNYFNVSHKSLAIFREESNKHLRDYLEEGLQYNMRLDNVTEDNQEIEESLFFYPLTGTINNLSDKLSGISQVNN